MGLRSATIDSSRLRRTTGSKGSRSRRGVIRWRRSFSRKGLSRYQPVVFRDDGFGGHDAMADVVVGRNDVAAEECDPELHEAGAVGFGAVGNGTHHNAGSLA